MFHSVVYTVGQARLADLHREAQRDALVHAARQARRARRQQSRTPRDQHRSLLTHTPTVAHPQPARPQLQPPVTS